MTKSHPPRTSSTIAWKDAPTRSVDVAGTIFAYADSIDAAESHAAALIIKAAPHRLLWGSDWPHTGPSIKRIGRLMVEIESFLNIDDAGNLAALARWAGSPAVLHRILVHNPAASFGWAAEA